MRINFNNDLTIVAVGKKQIAELEKLFKQIFELNTGEFAILNTFAEKEYEIVYPLEPVQEDIEADSESVYVAYYFQSDEIVESILKKCSKEYPTLDFKYWFNNEVEEIEEDPYKVYKAGNLKFKEGKLYFEKRTN